MKKSFLFKSAFFILASVLLAFSILSCKVGMGESIDLTAPVLTIESPRHGALTPQNVTIKGTAVDDRNLVGVEVKYKYKKEGKDVTGSKMAHIEGSKWSCDFVFDGDYEVEFEAYAYDSRRNGSDTSHDRVMVLIDSDPAGIEKMSIARGNYVARIIALEEFTREGDGKTALKNSSLNKDYFQNEELIILSNLNDKYGIGDVFLDLYEIDPNTLTETLVKNNIAPSNDTNKYSPEFTIKEDMINLPLGKVHYIKPHLRVKDEAGNFSDRTDGVFAWEPEYNTPHVSFNTMENGEIRVPQGAPIIVSIFDDDDLKYYDCWLVKRSSDSIDVNSVTSKKKVASGTFEKGMRSTAFDIGTDKDKDKDSDNIAIGLGQYWLVIKAVDESTTDRGRADGTYFKATPVRVTNMDAPMIFVDTEENSVPSLDTNGKFKLEGYVLDNESGNKIAIAWLGPNANSPEINAATIFFENYDFSGNDAPAGGKLWMIDSTNPTFDEKNYKYSFSGEKALVFDFFNDFPGDTNTAKVFMIAARDPVGNTTTKTFRFNKFPSTLKFEVRHAASVPSDTADVDDNPLVVLKPNTAQYFRINPKTLYGMGIKSFTVTPVDGSKTSDVTDLTTTANVCTFNITTSQAKSGGTINFKLSATDKLDNTVESNLTILFDEVGELQSITCNSNSEKTFIIGETIRLQANFSKKVTFYGLSETDKTKNPYIQLNLTDFTAKPGVTVGSTDLKAYYKSGTETNTVYFECVVPKGVEASKFDIPSPNPISLNGVQLYGTIGSSYTNGITGKNYKIDTIAPYITGITPTNNGVVAATMADGEAQSIEIEITFNEEVFVESGTITMQRADKYWYIPPVLTNDVFMEIYNASSTDEKKKLVGSSGATQTYTPGKDENGIDTLIADGPYMQYTNGLKLNGSNMVPDLTTKYVLAYRYGIGETSGVVQNLREVLEARNYHKKEFDVTRVTKDTTDKKKIKLKVSKDDFIGGLINGVEYTLKLTSNSFYDKAFNYYEAGTGDKISYTGVSEYKFWVGPTATPVIRVNRTATNVPIDENGNWLAGKSTNMADYKPTAKTSMKIDCVTPGATVTYKVDDTNKATAPNTSGAYTEADSKDTEKTMNNYGELTTASAISSGLTAETYTTSDPITLDKGTGEKKNVIGDGSLKTAQKIGIKATAQRSGMAAAYGYEGAFKTILHSVEPGRYFGDGSSDRSAYTGNEFRIYGAQIPEGGSYTSGWPLTQNSTSGRENWQVAWQDVNGDIDSNAKNSYYWVSWQILSGFTLQTKPAERGFQEHASPKCTYGQYIYYHQMNNW